LWETLIRTGRFQLTEGKDALFRDDEGKYEFLQFAKMYRGQLLSFIYICPVCWILIADGYCSDNCNTKLILLLSSIIAFAVQFSQGTPCFYLEHAEEQMTNLNNTNCNGGVIADAPRLALGDFSSWMIARDSCFFCDIEFNEEQ